MTIRNLIKTSVKAYFRMRGHYPTTIRGERFLCDPYHIALWRNAGKGFWEPYTYQVLERFLDRNSIYADIGAWVGPTVIFAARKSKYVYCFEPDYVAYRYLLWNLDLNNLTNVVPFNYALNNVTEMRQMAAFGEEFGSSRTSLIAPTQEQQITVPCVAWDDWRNLTGVDRLDFLKIDIEGGEFTLLPSMEDYLARYRPTLYLSLHTSFLPKEEQTESMNSLFDGLFRHYRCFSESMVALRREDLSSVEQASRFSAFLFIA